MITNWNKTKRWIHFLGDVFLEEVVVDTLGPLRQLAVFAAN